MEKNVLHVQGFEVKLVHKRIKNLYLRVYPDGTAVLTVPLGATDEVIQRFLSEKSKWLISHIPEAPVRPKNYDDNERLWILGISYALKETAEKTAYLSDGCLYMPQTYSREEREKAYYSFLKEKLANEASVMLPECEKATGKKVSALKFRKMSSRWGSCNVMTAAVTLSTELGKYPSECIRSVLLHELCHLHEASHGARFKQIFRKVCPEWMSTDKILKQHVYE